MLFLLILVRARQHPALLLCPIGPGHRKLFNPDFKWHVSNELTQVLLKSCRSKFCLVCFLLFFSHSSVVVTFPYLFNRRSVSSVG